MFRIKKENVSRHQLYKNDILSKLLDDCHGARIVSHESVMLDIYR